MKQIQQGFTLIELMIVVAIIGILAAVALPAYQDYTVRAKMSEVVLAASSGKTAISEFYQTNNRMPTDGGADPLESAGISNQTSKYVNRITYVRTSDTVAVVTAFAQTEVGGGVTTAQGVVLTGTANAGTGQVSWVCTGAGSIKTKYLPSNCRG